jgi:hypothetical protein
MTKSRGINQPKATWSDAEIETLRRCYPLFRAEDVATVLVRPVMSVYRKAKALGLQKADEFYATAASGRLEGVRGGATRFAKGLVPWNKGMKGLSIGNGETRFKPGQMPANTQPIGTYRRDAQGTLQRKISNDAGNNSKRWRAVHELVWVEANGPVPPKHIVVFKPGMRTTVLGEITIDRVECISLAENMKRNTRHNLPPELNEVVQLRAVLTRHINKRRKQHGA